MTEDCFASCERFIDAVSTIDELRRELATAQRELTEMTEEHDEARVAFADHGFDDDGKTLPELVECMNHAVGYAVDLASVAEKQRDKAWADMKRRGLVLMTTQPASDHATFAMVMICHKSQNKAFCDREAEPNPRTVGGLMWDCPNCDGPKTGSVTAIPFSPCMPSEVGAKLETLTAERGEAIKQRDEAIKQRDEAQRKANDLTWTISLQKSALTQVAEVGGCMALRGLVDTLAAQMAVAREALQDLDQAAQDASLYIAERFCSECKERNCDNCMATRPQRDVALAREKAQQALSLTPTQAEQMWKAMRDALRFYADTANWVLPLDCDRRTTVSQANADSGGRARQALARLDALKGTNGGGTP